MDLSNKLESEDVMNKQVLLMNDLAGYGKVALSAMMPILTHMGYSLYNLPTALVSNTLDYGTFEILDTTDYMKNTIEVWKKLGFRFDAISTGFIVTSQQAELLATFCREQASHGTIIFCDPIMGDEGHLYNGIDDATIRHMRSICSVADYIVPNYTEAIYLAGLTYSDKPACKQDMEHLLNTLRKTGAKSIVVTSVPTEHGFAVIGYDAIQDIRFEHLYHPIPVRFPGTGDIFSALMMGHVLNGASLCDSVKRAMQVVEQLIQKNMHTVDTYKGIPLESCMEVLDL